MNRTQLEKEWLVNSALIAFVGATLVAQSWRISSGSINLFGKPIRVGDIRCGVGSVSSCWRWCTVSLCVVAMSPGLLDIKPPSVRYQGGTFCLSNSGALALCRSVCRLTVNDS